MFSCFSTRSGSNRCTAYGTKLDDWWSASLHLYTWYGIVNAPHQLNYLFLIWKLPKNWTGGRLFFKRNNDYWGQSSTLGSPIWHCGFSWPLPHDALVSIKPTLSMLSRNKNLNLKTGEGGDEKQVSWCGLKVSHSQGNDSEFCARSLLQHALVRWILWTLILEKPLLM